MLELTAPGRLGRVRLVATDVKVPTLDTCVIDSTGSVMLAPSGAPSRRGGGRPRGPCDYGIQCCRCFKGSTPGT